MEILAYEKVAIMETVPGIPSSKIQSVGKKTCKQCPISR